jgi:hypothetical protein
VSPTELASVEASPLVARLSTSTALLGDRDDVIAAKRTGNGTSELVRQFDPTAKETLFIPRLVGG